MKATIIHENLFYLCFRSYKSLFMIISTTYMPATKEEQIKRMQCLKQEAVFDTIYLRWIYKEWMILLNEMWSQPTIYTSLFDTFPVINWCNFFQILSLSLIKTTITPALKMILYSIIECYIRESPIYLIVIQMLQIPLW